jgi:hypothetical protein
MLTKPAWLLRLEGLFVFALPLFLYRSGHYSWWLFVLLILSPDLVMLAYLINIKTGAAAYNFAHTLSLPLLLLLLGLLRPAANLLPFALIWIAHIGMDRMLGFGLKYPTSFNDTHLQHV